MRKKSRPKRSRRTGRTVRWRSSHMQMRRWRSAASGAINWSLFCRWPEKSSAWETSGVFLISAIRTEEVRRCTSQMKMLRVLRCAGGAASGDSLDWPHKSWRLLEYFTQFSLTWSPSGTQERMCDASGQVGF